MVSWLLVLMLLVAFIPSQVLSADTVEEPKIEDFETFSFYLACLEELAYAYKYEMDQSVDPLALVIKYIRTGVDRYNEGSWGIMAGYEDKNFAQFVKMVEASENEGITNPDEMFRLTSLKNIECFTLPNGDYVDFGHMFGTMDITYHNKKSQNHADVGGWAGDLVDLLSAADREGVKGTLEEMTAQISETILGKSFETESFSSTDILGDLDAFYIMNEIDSENYYYGDLFNLLMEYYTEDLSEVDRAKYFLNNRLDGVSLRATLRDKIYNEYMGNNVISTLEGTREFTTDNLTDLRKACCYAFADYICKLAGDYVESNGNDYFEVFSSKSSTLAPGVNQEIKQATTTDGKQMVYYLATGDLVRDDVNVYANYNENDPSLGWKMSRVIDQANAAQKKHSNPDDAANYIENYNVIASINGAGFNMSTGEPGGLLVMGGTEYHAINSSGFFGILKDGTPVVGTTEEYNTTYKGNVQEGIAVFGSTLVQNGKVVVKHTSNYYNDRASRTAVGITKTGKVVFMVLDGRQEPVSCGGSLLEIAHIMLEAGCVTAVNLDGGGSTTYVAKQEGEDALSVVNRPSDGFDRSVSTSLMMVSTAPSSTAFDHAVIESTADYLTIGSKVNLTAVGVSATGNFADLPEGTSWAVSDESIGTITPEGEFTAIANGDVSVYLMLGEERIATKTLGVVIPEGVFFTKTTQNLVYGSSFELPLKATYFGKNVAINENDLVLSMNNKRAGKFDKMTFIAGENTDVKTVTLSVLLTQAKPDSLAAKMTVSLYNQGEAVFDFNKATAGDTQFAWDRKVSNSTTLDNIRYDVIDAEKDMETSYIFAIDMSKIDIPDQLLELTYMLPGSDIQGVTAWHFLCQLAERISVLSTVKPVIKFDKNFDVDYSNLTIVNDYFKLEGTEFNEEENSLTLNLRWIDQTEPIDITSANPYCIVSGVKLTPKDNAKWGTDGSLTVVNSGEIGYKIYLRASALYSFSAKEENQEIFGLYPFINPDDTSEKGGYFSSIYKQFQDTYTLVTKIADGWVSADGGYSFFENGELVKGIKLIDGLYYDFGEDGICLGRKPYTGLFFNQELNAYTYAKFGQLESGWKMIEDKWYYFHSDKTAKAGTYVVDTFTYTFAEDGEIIKGAWVDTLYGTRYYYGPSYYSKGWQTIEGKRYFFENSYRYEGYRMTRVSNSPDLEWHYFDENGVCSEETIPDGLYDDAGKGMCYVVNGKALIGLCKVGNDYYYFNYRGYAYKGTTYTTETHCDLPCSTYTFGDDYKAVNGIREEADGYYYYVNGKPKMAGMIKIDDDYYFAAGDGKLITNKVYYNWKGNGLLPEGNYEFGPDGKMLQGVIEKENGEYCYYVNGQPKMAGLIEIDGDYYFAGGDGNVIVNRQYYVWKSNGLLPEGNYEFGPDGKMIQGVVEKADGSYYYVNGQPKAAGMILYDGHYYFAHGSDGRVIANKVYYNWKGNGLLPEGNYEFGPDGKMLDGIVEKDDGYYYYVKGQPKMAGLIEIDGAYYFAAGADGKLITDRVYYNWKSNGLLPEANYEYGPDGKMYDGIVEKADGYYYYVKGQPKMAGLIEIDGAYYFAAGDGKLITNQVYYVWKGNGILPEGNYEFGTDGKMYDGIVEKADGYYYYVKGQPKMAGLIEIDGAYYFAGGDGKLVTNQVYYVWKGNGILPDGNYEFSPEGKIYDGIVEKADGYYYYEMGQPKMAGLIEIDGYYYFASGGGKLITNQVYYVWKGNGLTIEMNYYFDEFGRVVL